MLTKAQAEVIYRLQNMGYLHDGAQIEPNRAFPERDNRDNACRRTLEMMSRKLYFRKRFRPIQGVVYEPVMTDINRAWDEWRERTCNQELSKLFPLGA